MSVAIGSQVFLNSGSPTMTVVHVNREGDVICTWYSRSGDCFQRQTFPPEVLTVIPEPEASPEVESLFVNV